MQVSFISALDMRFRTGSRQSAVSPQKRVKRLYYVVQTVLFILVSIGTPAHAGVVERVVAIVDDDVILLSEFEEALRDNERSGGETEGQKVLEHLVNRVLLLEQAKRFRIGNAGAYGEIKEDESIIDEYVEKRIKATIHIPYEKIESYYLNNMERYGDKSLYEVRDEIEGLLIRKELEKKLTEHIDELRKRAYIRIQLQ